MVDEVIVTPERVRGLGNVLSQKSLSDFQTEQCELTEITDVVNTVDMRVFKITTEWGDFDLELKFKATNQKLEMLHNGELVNKSNNYLKIVIDYTTEDWENKLKFVLLRNKQGKTYLFEYSDDGILVPDAVLSGNSFRITTYGVNNDNMRITTNELIIQLKESGFTTDLSSVSDDTSHDVISTIYLLVESKLSKEDYIVDDRLNIDSVNPVENRVITSSLNNIDSNIDEKTGIHLHNALQLLANEIRRSW